MSAARLEPAGDEPRYTKGFWIGLVAAAPVVGYGVRGALDAMTGVRLTSFLQYFVGAVVVHDLVLGPLVCVVGWFVARRVPPVAVAPVQAALIASGIVTLVSWPFVRGDGVTAGEPTFLSRDYTASLVVSLAAIWAVAGVWVSVAVISRRR